ncbi:MAG: hypothetical protein KJO50_09995 [Bacteroidia bacterium]|nr:hypothetical protein [Bacteroidia bacterium]MBT8230583.1 hypothetical protein [Bacteroidia bacterium]
MAGFGFGKRPRPRRFDYIPRFYDEAKEELQSRLDQHNETMSKEDMAKQRIRSGLRNKYYADPAYRESQVNKSNLRLVYIIIILFFITYLIIKSERFVRIIESLS